MSQHVFKIFYGEKDKSGKEYTGKDDDLLSEPLSKFAKINNKSLEDFAFYYKGKPIKLDKLLHIKDSIFSQNEGNKPKNIMAININTKSKPQKKETREKEDSQNVINRNESEKLPEESQSDNEETFVRRRRINKEYYNDIICPKCKTSAIIENNKDDLTLKILNCGNFHCLNNIKYDSFDDYVFDFDDESEKNLERLTSNKDFLQCGICQEHKKYLTPPNDFFYICSCGVNVCPECYKTHIDPGHNKVKLDDKDYYCLKHAEKFNSYCMDCNANFCEKCKEDHKDHEVESFSNIKPKREYVQKLADDADEQKEILLDFVEYIRASFDKVINTIENYLNSYIMIEKTMIRRFKMGHYNYQLLRNLKNKKLFENDIFATLKSINEENKKIEEEENKENKENNNIDLKSQFITLFNKIYKPIKTNKTEKKPKIKIHNINENIMKMTYFVRDNNIDKRIKIFDPVFVENNKNILSLSVNGRDQKELSVYYNNNNPDDKGKPIIDVIIKEKRGKNENENKYVTDMSYMFNNCKYLKSVDFQKWKTDNITSMEAMFQLCNIDNKDIINISKLNISKLENIRAMFCKCTQLKTLPDINTWFLYKESSIKNTSMLFNGCKNFGKNDDINLSSEWAALISKSEDMSYMFNRCKNLKAIHKLKNLKKLSVKSMCGMFNMCEKLESITMDIDASSLEDMSIMFQGCESLTKMDIRFSNNTKLVKDVTGIFSGCKKLTSIKYFYLYSTENLVNMMALFKNCESLNTLPDLTKWSFPNVENAKGIFYECKKLVAIPKWLPQWKFNSGIKFEEVLEKSNFDQNLKNTLIKSWDANKIIKEAKNEIISG